MTTMRPFPCLPSEITSTLDAEHLRLERLGAQPETWQTVADEELLALLEHALIVGAVTGDTRRWGPTRDSHGLVVARTTDQARLAVFESVARRIEDLQRCGGSLSEALALVPFIDDDPAAVVDSSSTLAAVVLMGGQKGNPLEGRATVLRFTKSCEESDRQCAMMQGLLALGDPAVVIALRGSWRPLSDELRDDLCQTACQLPFPSTVEFLLRWAEDALSAGEGEREMCRPISALSVLGHVASGRKPGRYAGKGIYELIRNYPAAAFPVDEVAVIGQSWTVSEFGARIESRLRALAGHEHTEPIMTEICLAVWGRSGA